MADRVLITGARAAAALELAREFRAAGWEVHLADSSPARLARWSRAPHGVHRYAPPALDRAGFRCDLDRLVAALQPRLIVPCCEEVFHLAARAGSGAAAEGEAARLFAPPLPLLRQLHDKLEFAQLCGTLGLPVPESMAFDPGQPPADPAAWVFKPRFSRFGGQTLLGPSPQQLARLGPAQGWLAQRRISGVEHCFHAIAHSGAIAAFVAYRSDWKLGGGASFAFTPVTGALAERLRALAGTLARATGLTGQFACDAIVDGSGQPWLIECNPRATSGVHLLADHGALARAIADGETIRPHGSQSAYVGPVMWTYGLPAALHSGRLRQWRETMRGGRDVVGHPGDRWPALGALVDGIGFTLHGARRGMSATMATTRDIEWNGEDLS